MMDLTKATVTLSSTSAYSQSRKHDTPKLEGEAFDDYEKRTWTERMHVKSKTDKIGGKKTQVVVIPATGMSQSIAAAAKFLNKKIEGQRNHTWTKHFEAGLAILEDIEIGHSPEDCRRQMINAHANGTRYSGTRVTRYFPTFDEWTATFDVMIFDPMITEGIFTEVLEAAGLFVGIGQFRPQNLGTNGRWVIDKIDWHDARSVVPSRKLK